MKICYETARNIGLIPTSQRPKLGFFKKLSLAGIIEGIEGYERNIQKAGQDIIDQEYSRYLVDRDLMLYDFPEEMIK